MQQTRRFSPGMTLILLGTLILSLTACNGSIPTTNESSASPTQQSEHLVRLARSMLGKPYHYGGISPKTGFDCSGLVYYTHKRLGKTLPRSSSQQFRASTPVAKHDIKRGDLLFFRIYRRRISHVGIYLGNNRFVHAPSSGKEVSIAELDSPYWSKRFVRGGRFF